MQSSSNHLRDTILLIKSFSSEFIFLLIFVTKFKFSANKMRAFLVCVVLALVVVAALALPFPQNFDEAVKQAQSMSLIPKGAVVDRTFSGTQVAYFQLGRNDRVNGGDLAQALDGVPPEIIANLEAQIANAQ